MARKVSDWGGNLSAVSDFLSGYITIVDVFWACISGEKRGEISWSYALLKKSSLWPAPFVLLISCLGRLVLHDMFWMITSRRCGNNLMTKATSQKQKVRGTTKECVGIFWAPEYSLVGCLEHFLCFHKLGIIEGSLEVKLPTIWTVEKQR